jgi:hypothetical protein
MANKEDNPTDETSKKKALLRGLLSAVVSLT